jgi:hypothetical protein
MTIRIDGTNTAANPGITGSDTDTGLQFGTDEVNIVTGGSTAVTVDSSQRVGIATASPTDPLTVHGGTGANATIRLNGGTNSDDNARVESGFNLVLACNGDGNQSGRVVQINNNTTELARFTTDGLTFNGDTAAANALDDYEEGTWTPSFVHGTNGANMYVSNGLTIYHADYRKIGNLVYVSCYIENNTSFNYDTGRGGSDPLGIGGLPFTVSNAPAGSGFHPIYVGWFNNWTGWGQGYTPMGYFYGGLNNMNFVYATANGITQLSAQYMYSASSAIIVSGWYETN